VSSDAAPRGPVRDSGAVPGPVTAEDVRNARFSQAAHSAGGLSEDEVNSFIAAVAEALADAEARRHALRAEVRRLRSFFHAQGTGVDQPDERYGAPRTDPVSRSRQHLTDLASLAQRYAATSTLAPGPAAEQMLAAGSRRSLEIAHDLLYPAPPVEPATREQAERILRWLDAFVLAMQIQEREAYDTLSREVHR
jgi:DivIVA domain-containing protein